LKAFRLPHTYLKQKSGKLLVVNSLRAVLSLFTLVPIARLKEWFWPRSCAHFGERNSHTAGKIYNAMHEALPGLQVNSIVS